MTIKKERYLQSTSEATTTSDGGKMWAIAGTLAQPVCATMIYAALAYNMPMVALVGVAAATVAVGVAISGFIDALTSRTHRLEFKSREVHAPRAPAYDLDSVKTRWGEPA